MSSSGDLPLSQASAAFRRIAMSPYCGLLFLGIGLPVGWLLVLSVEGPNLKHFRRLIAEPVYLQVFLNTIELAALVTCVCALLAYPLALLLLSLGRNGRRWLLALVLVPFWTSVLVRNYAWLVLLQREGVVNRGLQWLGVTSEPLTLVHNNVGVIIGMTYTLLPYMVLCLFSSLSSMDPSLRAVAASLGAGRVTTFVRVILPLSRDGLLAGSLITFLAGTGFFITPALLGGVNDVTAAMVIEAQMNRILDWGFAAALAVTLTVLVLVLAGAARRWLEPQLAITSTAGMKGGARFGASRRGLIVTVGGCLSLAFLIGPLLAVLMMSVSSSRYLEFPPPGYSSRWYSNLWFDTSWRSAFTTSLIVASTVALCATVVGALAASALGSIRAWWRDYALAIALSPLVIPGIVVAVGSYVALSHVGLVETRIGLVLVHTTLAMPVALLCVMSSLRGLDVRLEHVAATLGASQLERGYRVILPLIRNGLLAAAAFAFMTSFDEPVVSLFISGTRAETLPKRMWDGIQYDIDPTSSAVAALLTVLSIIVVSAVVGGNRRVESQ